MNGRHPFSILGLGRLEVEALNDRGPRRRSSLEILRRYYSSFLHPDISGQPGSILAEINGALDTLSEDIGFRRAYETYDGSSPQTGAYTDVLKDQAQWLKNCLGKQASKYQTQIEALGKQIEADKAMNSGLERALFNAQQQAATALRPKLQQLTRECIDLRKANRQAIMSFRQSLFRLMGELAKDGSSVPQGTLPLSKLVGMTLEQKRAWFRVDEGLLVTWGLKTKTGLGKPKRTLGILVGFLTPEDRLHIKGTKLTWWSKGYDETLFSIKLYFKEGMYLVTKRGRAELHIYRPIEKVGTRDRGKAATVNTL